MTSNPSLEHLKLDKNRKINNPIIGKAYYRNLQKKINNHTSIVLVINIL